MEDKKFTNIKELLDFILTECGDMKFITDFLDSSSDLTGSLQITKGFDMERIYYAYVLAKKIFNVDVEELYINELSLNEIPEGFLEKMYKLKKFWCVDNNLVKIPKLSDSIVSFYCDPFGEDIMFINDETDKFRRVKTSGFIEYKVGELTLWFDDAESYTTYNHCFFQTEFIAGKPFQGTYYFKSKEEVFKLLHQYDGIFSEQKLMSMYNVLKHSVTMKKIYW